jgi:hypothetical protein
MMAIAKLKPAAEGQDLEKILRPPDMKASKYIDESSGRFLYASAGEVSYAPVNLETGTYIYACFLPVGGSGTARRTSPKACTAPSPSHSAFAHTSVRAKPNPARIGAALAQGSALVGGAAGLGVGPAVGSERDQQMTERVVALRLGGFTDIAIFVFEEDSMVDRKEPRGCGGHG